MTTPNTADIEIQDELNEITQENNQGEGQAEQGSEGAGGEAQGDEAQGEQGEQGDGGEQKQVIDKNDPLFKAGRKSMQESMQVAFDKRIQKLVGNSKHAENKLRDEFNKKFEELQGSIVVPQQKAPQLKDYETEEEYVDAAIDYKLAGGGKKKPEAKAEPKAESPAYDNSPERAQFSVKEQEYIKTNPNYYANLGQLEPFLTPDLLDCIYSTTPDVANYLSLNLDVAAQVAGLRPTLMGRALGAIEQKFKKGKPGSSQVNKKPAPVTESSGGSSNSKMPNSQNEYSRMRAKMDSGR